MRLHGSGGFNSVLTVGTLFTGSLVSSEVWQTNTNFRWGASNGGATNAYPGGPSSAVYKVFPRDLIFGMPNDLAIGGNGETYWIGTANWNGNAFDLHTERKLDAMLTWIKENTPSISQTRWVATGDSMGAWGGGTYSVRRPQFFAAVYIQNPRWRYHGDQPTQQVWLNDFLQAFPPKVYPYASSPLLPTGVSAAAHVDCIAYAANPANQMAWIGWTIGRNDGYGLFSDQVAAIAAFRATKRGFAVAWNNGNHGSQPNIESNIKNSYPTGLFEVGKGYPLFTNHSLDADPAVDLVGGINIGLSFRNVVETATSWSCEVTSLVSACSVTVEPKSTVFTAAVTPQTVSIPGVAAWVSVNFAA